MARLNATETRAFEARAASLGITADALRRRERKARAAAKAAPGEWIGARIWPPLEHDHPALPPAEEGTPMTAQELDQVAADLDLVRTLGGLAPRRAESLRKAANLMRSIASGEFASVVAETQPAQGAMMTAPRREEARR